MRSSSAHDRHVTPLPYDGFQEQVEAVMDLMTLVAHAPAGVLSQTLRYRTTNPSPTDLGIEEQDAELYGQQIHWPAAGAKETERVDYLFTLDDVNILHRTDLLRT
jgi:hypothetical protein